MASQQPFDPSGALQALFGNQAQTADPIAQYYRELFGRDPDAEGLQYWTGRAPELGTGNPMREAMISGAAPVDANYFGNRNTSEADWAAYRQRAAQQDQGINNMPGVFSDYGALAGQSPEQVQSILHHDADGLQASLEKWKALYGNIGSLGSLGGAGVQAAPTNPASR